MSEPRIYFTKVPTRQYDSNFNSVFIKGRIFPVLASSGSTRDVYPTTFSGSLIGMSVHMNTYTDGDYWNLSGSDWQTFSTIYTKDTPESFGFEIGISISSGSQVIFDFYNSGSIAKTVWIDYYFVR